MPFCTAHGLIRVCILYCMQLPWLEHTHMHCSFIYKRRACPGKSHKPNKQGKKAPTVSTSPDPETNNKRERERTTVFQGSQCHREKLATNSSMVGE
jgi:hypothetical protein